MSDQIQTTYPLAQERGQVGSISRPLAPFDEDAVVIDTTGAGMKPGQAFKFDSAGEAVPLASLADTVNAEGILGFQIGTINQTLAGGTLNLQGIEYAAGDKVKYTRSGYVYVIAGGTLAKGAEVGFNPATGKWVAQAGTGFVAANAAVADAVLEVIAQPGLAAALATHEAVGATFVIGAEDTNVINLGVTLLDAAGVAIAAVQDVEIFLSDDSAGLAIAATAPDGGWAIGTDGAIISATVAGKSALVQSEATGMFDLDITESGALTVYAVVILPNGQQVVSTAITFAA